MKDKLLFGTIGLLVGVVVMQWTGATYVNLARANYVDHAATGIVAFSNGRVLDENGLTWEINLYSGGWGDWGPFDYQLPVPVAQVKFYTPAAAPSGAGTSLITVDNHVWLFDHGQWLDLGQWPGAPVAVEQSTWGQIKAKFNKKADKP